MHKPTTIDIFVCTYTPLLQL